MRGREGGGGGGGGRRLRLYFPATCFVARANCSARSALRQSIQESISRGN